MPLRIENSLAQVTTGYTVFEPDQVLTHLQLNSVADYADDQIRLSRVRLGGVGIACGLQVALAGTTVRVTGGVGVTTDGDLLYLDGDAVYDRWRPYDSSFPAYPPLYELGNVNGAMHDAWELFPAGAEGSPGRPLGELAAATGATLADLAAVLLMESYRQDDDLCSGTDCDNLGARAVNTRKLLLVERAALPALRGGQATAGDAYAQLPEIGADRPVLTASIASATDLATAYRGACTAIHSRLLTALPRLFTPALGVLAGAVPAGSWDTWRGRLTTYQGDYSGARAGIQYYYDFLKDVVETYNELRERLFDDDTWCTPPIATFPKHLLLGELTPTAGAADNRTDWYPSPVTSPTAGALDQARFLVQRLDALIRGFSVSTNPDLAVRVTPSMAEDRPLDDRAIPFYYTPGGADPVRRHWSWRLVRRGAADTTCSYHAPAPGYAPAGSPAAAPLAFQVGRSTFFRVEGVVGKAVGAAMDDVQRAIRDFNLPFAVRAVLLGNARGSVHRERGPRLTDMDHLHRVIRQDTGARLADVEAYTLSYSEQVLAAADADDVFLLNETTERNLLRTAGTTGSATVVDHATNALAFTGGSYTEYLLNASALQSEIAATINAGANLSHNTISVLQTGILNPADTLYAGTVQLLPLIDNVLLWKEQKEDERLFFGTFLGEHPQAEHLGGVPRGGTLVLLHNTSGTVVGEVMLPYTWLEEPVDETEPDLEVDRAVPPVFRQPPVQRVPSRRWTFEQEWTAREPELNVLTQARDDVNQWIQFETTRLHGELDWQRQFLQQQNLDFVGQVAQTYNGVLNNSWTYAGVKYTPESTTATRDFGVQDLGDELLGTLTEAMRQQARTVSILEQVAAAGNEAVREQLDGARRVLAGLAGQTAQRLDVTGAPVGTGTAGAAVVQDITGALDAIKGTDAFDAARNTLEGLARDTANRALGGALGKIFKRR